MRLGRAPLIDEAAQIWAEATAARDGHDQVPHFTSYVRSRCPVLICDQTPRQGKT
jgi:hypothetical protein